jgi:hypothetical protein
MCVVAIEYCIFVTLVLTAGLIPNWYNTWVGTRQLLTVAILSFLLPAGLWQGFSPVAWIPICAIQGSGLTSPYQGRTVVTRGEVTLDLDDAWQRGFYLQAENCDSSPATSDGLFVYLGDRLNVVNSGDLVEVRGIVNEYYGLTEILAAPEDVQVLSSGNPHQRCRSIPTDEQAPVHISKVGRAWLPLAAGRWWTTDADDCTWLVRSIWASAMCFTMIWAGRGRIRG